MKRTIKKPEERKNDIITAAEKLFASQGYTKTSVEMIILESGIAKGTFYYYFKSKKQLLSALVHQTLSSLAEHFTVIADMDGTTAIEKLRLMLRGPEKEKRVESPVMEIVHRPENRELQEDLNVQAIKVISPIIARVIQQGNEDGSFDVANPEESVQILLAGAQFIFDSGLFEWSPEKEKSLLKTYQSIFEKTLGAQKGTLDFISHKKY